MRIYLQYICIHRISVHRSTADWNMSLYWPNVQFLFTFHCWWKHGNSWWNFWAKFLLTRTWNAKKLNENPATDAVKLPCFKIFLNSTLVSYNQMHFMPGKIFQARQNIQLNMGGLYFYRLAVQNTQRKKKKKKHQLTFGGSINILLRFCSACEQRCKVQALFVFIYQQKCFKLCI